ncbi:DNA alkylation repair protein [Romboutsia weinsteinii]|uniref:DNA alkylation repair protein n=1 Tax=Romboutsia weinsteinii TaxID=2020949 RepID=A0A371J2S7_9FIRM|nr:DNA alkylation repair protein [Romboutsia weinsteinii]RDY27089.1 DNA alkylation repair protein [Romboutsia weinsteinii]
MQIRNQLMELSEEKYRNFSMKLLPGVNNILGIRLPNLRKIAQKIAKDDWRSFLKNNEAVYFEEIMLEGMVLGYVKDAEIDEMLKYIAYFIPKIDNWSLCDSFCVGLKLTKNHKEEIWKFLQPYLSSDKEFEVRFAVVMMLNFYVDNDYIDDVLKHLDNIKHEGYYVKMAVAWAVSICYKKFKEITIEYLNNNTLDDFTFNKSLQKIGESLKCDNDTKLMIKKMRR